MKLLVIPVLAQVKKEKQIAAAVERYHRALIDADEKALRTLTSDKLSYGHSNGNVEDKETFIKNIISGNSDFVRIEMFDLTITLQDKTALVRYNMKAETNDKGKPGSIHLKVLLVWVINQRQWKLLARQSVRLS
ncbi:MAG: nuclear transport factor 2 family protein [Chitinophagaceae bacterium]|nr:nuclear transport factor 2 family protein [Chitinophagaceae bacterium]